MAYDPHISVIFTDSAQMDTLEKYLLSQGVQRDIAAGDSLALTGPYSSSIASSRHSHMRELRVQHAGRPYRILYAFDPRRTAILLIGGEKTGDDRWYETYVPLADRLYDEHLAQLRQEGERTDGEEH
jgi:hypothetical protein